MYNGADKNGVCLNITHLCDLNPYTGIRIGQAKHPGPFRLEIANVTHLVNQGPRLAQRPFNALVVGEHSLTKQQECEIRPIYGNDIFCNLSNLVPDNTHQLGGVGILTKGKRPIVPDIICKELKEHSLLGRVGLFAAEVLPGRRRPA